jgi:NAD(P)H-quinone oxidoreductase subunit 5
MNSTPWLPLLIPALVISMAWLPGIRKDAERLATGAQWASTLATLLALVIAITQFLTPSGEATVLSWMGWVYVDRVSAVMLLLVSFLGAVVLRYSAHYLGGDPGRARFLRWLCLTTGSVLVLILSGNFILFFLAWLSTSLCLHQLLTFFSERPAARLAARKKFIISRLGDLCMIGVMILAWRAYGSLDFATLLALPADRVAASGVEGQAMALLLVAAALLKSAQVPFHSWLPDTMETPTPVSALMHAGIINAGGYLIIRTSPLVAPHTSAMVLLTVFGAATAILASLIMLTQTNIKKSLAFSTVAQMGFMLLQCGLGAFALALLHILAHSLYKAHAFLSSGSVVDMAKASWVPPSTGKPHPILLALLLLASTAIAWPVAMGYGLTWERDAGVLALTLILIFGVIHLIWNGWPKPFRAPVVARLVGLAAVVGASYLFLHALAESLFGAFVAQAPSLGVGGGLWPAWVVLLFAATLIFQAQLPYQRGPFWTALHIHASQGFYLGILSNELVRKLWPERRSS